jgi:hypothetical protein
MWLDLTAAGITLNGKPLEFPLAVAEFSNVLGQPSRTVEKVSTIYVWDAIGIYAYCKPGSQYIDSVAVALNRLEEYDFSPKAVFAGRITLGSIDLRDIDTPRSLNRRLKGFAFNAVDPYGLYWRIDFPRYRIGMDVATTGLSDTITIQGP